VNGAGFLCCSGMLRSGRDAGMWVWRGCAHVDSLRAAESDGWWEGAARNATGNEIGMACVGGAEEVERHAATGTCPLLLRV
jgi:hypothetical protein